MKFKISRSKTMNDEKRVFRNSVGGYNKDDVNSYIMNINNRFSAAEETYKDEIRNLNEQLSLAQENSAALSVASETLINTEHRLSEAQSQIEEKEQLIEKYRLQESDMIKKINELENRCLSLSETIEKLQKDIFVEKTDEENKLDAPINPDLDIINENICEKLENESDRKKILMYDKISAQIGDIMISANKNAEEILKNAEETAKNMIDEGMKRAADTKMEMQNLAEGLISELNRDIKTSTEACIKEFKDYVEEITYNSKIMAGELENKYQEMTGKINYYQNALEESISKRFSEISKN